MGQRTAATGKPRFHIILVDYRLPPTTIGEFLRTAVEGPGFMHSHPSQLLAMILTKLTTLPALQGKSTLGGLISANISSTTDVDWFRVTLYKQCHIERNAQ
jgi:hypothetical protein